MRSPQNLLFFSWTTPACLHRRGGKLAAKRQFDKSVSFHAVLWISSPGEILCLLWVFHAFVRTSSLQFSERRLRRLWRNTAVGTHTWSTWRTQGTEAQACLAPRGFCGWFVFFPTLRWCVPLHAVLGPLWTNLLRSAYWVRENEEGKQLLVEELCAKVLCAKAVSFVGRLGNILAMKIVCSCCWHNQFLQICLTFTWVLLKHWMCCITRAACCTTHKW